MNDDAVRIKAVIDDQVRFTDAVLAIWGRVKKAAKWAKDHVVGGAKWIGLKFRF